MGERTGKKANQEEIERQMRNARNERNERLFQREEWLTKTQRKFFFFSRLASRQRTRGQDAISKEQSFDIMSNSMQISTKVRQGSKNKNRSSFAY